MRTKRRAAVVAVAIIALASPTWGWAAPITPEGSTEVTVGSNDICSRRTSRTSRGSR